MKKRKLHVGWLIYLISFAWLALGSLLNLLSPHSDAHTYYKILLAFRHPSGYFYFIAVLSVLTTITSCWTLYCQAYNIQPQALKFFRMLFVLRISTEVFSHNYEWQFYKSALKIDPVLTIIALLIFIAYLSPSYIIHFNYAFRRSSPGSNS